jgi:hypothetical protein
MQDRYITYRFVVTEFKILRRLLLSAHICLPVDLPIALEVGGGKVLFSFSLAKEMS